MKVTNFIWISFCVMCGVIQAQTVDLHKVRTNFNQGIKNEDICEQYFSLLKDNASNATEKGYSAAFEIFMAKHVSNPIKRLQYFKSGRDNLEKIIQSNASNVELRFIRLCIQYYAPKYLGYHKNIDEDKEFVKNNLHKFAEPRGKKAMYDYLKGAKMYTETELELLGR